MRISKRLKIKQSVYKYTQYCNIRLRITKSGDSNIISSFRVDKYGCIYKILQFPVRFAPHRGHALVK